MNLSRLEISSGVELDVTRLMLMLRSTPRLDNITAGLLPEVAIAAMQATELLEPLPDWESAARQAGWITAEMTPGMVVKPVLGQPFAMMANTWKEACRIDDLSPALFPVTRVLATTPKLGAMLELMGERTDTMFGWRVWADFRDEQKHSYLLNHLGSIYQHSEILAMQVDELVARWAAQEQDEKEGA